MTADSDKPLANPRRPTIVPWRIGMLWDWAHATQPMIDCADAVMLALEQAQAAGQIDRPVEWVVRKVYGGPNAATLSEVIQEMLLTTTSERQGRVIDHDQAASMEKKKREGYF